LSCFDREGWKEALAKEKPENEEETENESGGEKPGEGSFLSGG
jgi:hypothetical protein